MGGCAGNETGKPLLEEPGGQAIGHTQVIQALGGPLIQFEQQGRQVLPGGDDLFQQADGLEAGEQPTGRGSQVSDLPSTALRAQTEQQQQDRLPGSFPRFSNSRSTSESGARSWAHRPL